MVSAQEQTFNRWIGRVLLGLALLMLAATYVNMEILNEKVERLEQQLGISGASSPRREARP